MSEAFPPIAIIGRGCVLPGCASTNELWKTVAAGDVQISEAIAGDWRVPMQSVLSEEPGHYVPDHSWSARGGYVRDFPRPFEPNGTTLEAGYVARLDPVFQWSLDAARQALEGVWRDEVGPERAGLVLGNLSYPTRAHVQLAEQAILQGLAQEFAGLDVAQENRFMSGFPAMLVAQAFGLGGGSLALDAACASGLYAIKHACDRLQMGNADLMLAGAVNAADQLFLHVGFSALNAMSYSGQSRPFHHAADGLIPAEGAACVALKRLADAEAAGDTILGVIRGVGLSNDGRSGGFLSPDSTGQVRSMRSALSAAGMSGDAVQYIECHATGTLTGDAVEIASLKQVYGRHAVALGSLKANLGHTITVSGIAGLLKVLSAMEHGVMPGTPGSRPLSSALVDSPFRVPEQPEDWPLHEGQRTAAISSFGFGGNNAHLVVQQYAPRLPRRGVSPAPAQELAIVGIGIRTHLDADRTAFAARLLGGEASTPPVDHGVVRLSAKGLAFPPADLKKTLGQQLVLLDVVRWACAGVSLGDPERTAVYVGMQTDSEACRYGARIRWPELSKGFANASVPPEHISSPLDAAQVIGKMPNIVANRLSNLLDLRGPSFAISREELSGDAALELACTALRRGEVDTALVAAVDLCREDVHIAAANAVLGPDWEEPADAAVMLAVKRREQAERDGDPVFALLDGSVGEADLTFHNTPAQSIVYGKLGHSHAASGLLHVALAALALHSRVRLDDAGNPQPLLRNGRPLRAAIHNTSHFGEQSHWGLLESGSPASAKTTAPMLRCYAAADSDALKQRLRDDLEGGEGPCRLALVGAHNQLESLRKGALQRLESGDDQQGWQLDGIVFRPRPIIGELAFAFTGAAAAYAGMGRELLLGMPGLTDGIAGNLKDAQGAAGWAYQANDPCSDAPFYQLAGSSFLCQVHAHLSRDALGLCPAAAIGLSSGETNAMFAFGIWDDMDGLFRAIDESGLYREALGGVFHAVRTFWDMAPDAPLVWSNYRIKADAEAVVAAVAETPRVFVTIINSPMDSVIGGDEAACKAVLKTLGDPPSVSLGHDLAVHCPVVQPFERQWRALHTRPTTPIKSPRFYSNYFRGVYEPSWERVADALTGQALQTIDFPCIVNQAWQDGVRIFVEHGPRNGLTSAIGEILGEREHLAVALDRPGVSGLVQVYRAAAELWCAGVPVVRERLRSAAHGVAPVPAPLAEPVIGFSLRPAYMEPKAAQRTGHSEAVEPYASPALQAGLLEGRLPPASPLNRPRPADGPSMHDPGIQMPASIPEAHAAMSQPATAVAREAALADAVSAPGMPGTRKANAGLANRIMEQHRQLTQTHQTYLSAQRRALTEYLEKAGRSQVLLMGYRTGEALPVASAVMTSRSMPVAAVKTQGGSLPPAPPTKSTLPVPDENDAREGQVASDPRRELPGPSFTRKDLEILAGGRISSIFGARFSEQDRYAVQVRMPEPPLLLCDRVLGIEGAPQGMGRGRIWTETDVLEDSWYLHHGRMPPGIFIECGQADLLLISWLGIDAYNKGERAYRLLGCDLTFHGEMPRPGETLEYEISVDAHARQGDVRLFFFHYDCHVAGKHRISVRNGQAGFFTRAEMDQSSGVIWIPEQAEYSPQPRLIPPPKPTPHRQFSADRVQAYLAGDLVSCFGEDFFLADTHTRTPRTPAGKFCFLGEVTSLEFSGGPAGRGYLRVETPVQGDEWFFEGHFKNDPCMPGTLMADACGQAMSFYMAAAGYTLERDGWRFQPVLNVSYTFVCRGQVTPDSKRIVYEVFVDELYEDAGLPTLFAHVLCSVDGRKAFLCEGFGLQLVPDWPLTSMPAYTLEKPDSRQLAYLGDFPLDHASLIHCAWGQPSRAFGQGFAHYDGPRRSPRLPGPPYHFMTRILELHAEMAQMRAGARVKAVYDIEPDAWYFSDNPAGTLPACVLMEIALQPCGWLASYVLSQKASARELVFRNLDGESVLHREIGPGDRSLTTEVELISVSQVGDLVIDKFSVHCSVGDEVVMEVETVFGFFPPSAMLNQKGFGADKADTDRLLLASDTDIDLRSRPFPLFDHSLPVRLPEGRLLMIDHISGHWPQGGARGLGAIRSEKDIHSADWFFKAHFFQDPVQPGSLGIEAILQTIQAFMLLENMAADMARPRFEPLLVQDRTIWHYRGQVIPGNVRVTVEFDVEERGRDERGVFVRGFARLWVDGLMIYQAPRIGVRMVETSNPALTIAMRECAAAQLRLCPSMVAIDAVDGSCSNLPFNRYMLEADEPDAIIQVQADTPAPLDWEQIAQGWTERVGGNDGSGFAQDLGVALFHRFVRRVVLADPAGYAALRGRPVLYLANHQTMVESFLFLSLAVVLGQCPTWAIAKQEHRDSWVGKLLQLANLEMGESNPSGILLFNRGRQSEMLRLLDDFGTRLKQQPRSLLVHVDGTRALNGGEPVRMVSAVLLDLALKYDLPMVPVRFAGGLSVAPIAARLDFPFELGQQDYYLGQAILPEELAEIPCAQRAATIIDRINALGPAGDADRPLPGDPLFAQAVAGARAEGRGEIQAVLYAALRDFPGIHPETEALLRQQKAGVKDAAAQLVLDLIGDGEDA